MFYMKNKLGSWQVGNDTAKGSVEFKIFFPKGWDPQIKSIRVSGDFQSQISSNPDWDFQSGFELTEIEINEGSIWSYKTSAELNAGFYQYKYYFTFNDGTVRIISDPCSRYGGTDSQNAAFVIGGSRPQDNIVSPLKAGRKHIRDLSIYELNLDDFTAGYRGKRAPIDAVVDKLDYIKNLGFNAILFMPWTAWKNRDFDWGYEPFQFFAVEYRYANDIDHPSEKISWLKKLINECHDRDLHVIMDGVYNHVSNYFPYKQMYLNTADCPFTGEYGGAFPGLQDLNFYNDCTNRFILDVCIYWMDVFKIDGIRFDNTVNYYVAGNPNGLRRILSGIKDYLDSAGENNFSLTIEHLREDAAWQVNNSQANSYWDNDLYGCTFDYLWRNTIDSKLLNSLNNQRFLESRDKTPTAYLSNHDHSQIIWRTGANNNSGFNKWYKIQPYLFLLYTCTAVPLSYNGAEFGECYWLPESDNGTGRRVAPRPLRWKFTTDKIGISLLSLYKQLNEIRNQYAGLRSVNFYPQQWDEWQKEFNPQGYGVDEARQIVIYHRWGNDENGVLQKFIIVLNFSDQPQEISVPLPENGVWTDLLSDNNWKPEVSNWNLCFKIESNWGHIFFR